MMTKPDGGSAFGQPGFRDARCGATAGMSLRDYFAAKALPEVMAHTTPDTLSPVQQVFGEVEEVVAQKAYAVADAMLAEREKGDGA